jgi:hypothetical protein
MSINWVRDIEEMHDHYDMIAPIDGFDTDKLKALLEFRIKFLEEEMRELRTAENADDVVDALIDLCVVAIGTLDQFGVDAYTAWDRVLHANMNKTVGIKPGRPNPLGLPDLMKPDGWVAPWHGDNVGRLNDCFTVDAIGLLHSNTAYTYTEFPTYMEKA